MSELREKCGVGGIYLSENEPDHASALLYNVMFALQHRGDEATGMASKDPNGALNVYKARSEVRDAYTEEIMAMLTGRIACGQGMYSTSYYHELLKDQHLQPVYDRPSGFAFVHNGNIPRLESLESYLRQHNIQYLDLNDSEKAGTVIGQRIRTGNDLPSAVRKTYGQLKGAFSCIAIHGDTMVAFRDPFGIRPLAIGKFGESWAVSSETCGLDSINAQYHSEVQPGEMVIISGNGIEREQLAEGKENLDIFEMVYFSRADSYLYGRSVHQVRKRAGKQLAEEHGPLYENTENVIVVPVPETSTPIAEGYSQTLGLELSHAIYKNRYSRPRNFMQPTEEARKRNARRKHNIIKEEVEGKDVILMDDSIVRLDTIPNLVRRLYKLGSNSVSVLIGSPPVRFPDFYGVDTPHQSQLAAANMTVEQMKQKIHPECHYLGFLTLDRLITATGVPAEKFNLSCFNGDYPISIGEHQKDIKTPVSMEYVK